MYKESLSTFRTLHTASPHSEASEFSRGESVFANLLGFKDNAEFIKWVEGKIVLDLGSGTGGLAVSIADLGIDAKIVSLDSNLGGPEFDESQKGHIAAYYERELSDPDITDKVISLKKAHDKLAVRAAWPNLPFANKSFDSVISANAFPLRDESTLEEVSLLIERLSQILKDEGEIRIAPVFENVKRKYELVNKDGQISPFLKSQLEKFFLHVDVIPLDQKVHQFLDPAYCLIIKKLKNN